MLFVKLIFRFIYIHYVLVKYGLDKAILQLRWLGPLRFVIYLNPLHWVFRNNRPRGERLRLALEELGPIYVKFGQILSVRYDLLPNDIIHELSKLQDSVPPFSGDKAWQIIEDTFGAQYVNHYFTSFDRRPIASASIAQVHRATLADGTKVAVKVLRPNIDRVIREDIALLYLFSSFLEKLWPASRRAKPKAIVAEFERTIYDELDLMREAANASQLKRNFQHNPELYVPEIYWHYTTYTILVSEFIYGIPVHDVETLRAKNVNLKKLAEDGVTIFFTQVFRDCFFHADLHPGNIMVDYKDPRDPYYLAVDFGIMGALSPYDQQYLAENMIAFFRRDYRQVAKLHIDSGWIDPDTRIEEFEATIRAVCEPVFERPLKEISFGHLLAKLFRTAKRYNMEVQPQLLMLQKTLLNVESLGRRLYPELNLWETAKPFLEDWLKQQTGFRYLYNTAKQRAPYWLRELADMPDLLYQRLQRPETVSTSQQHTVNRQGRVKKRRFPLFTSITALVLITYGVFDRFAELRWGMPIGDIALILGGGLALFATVKGQRNQKGAHQKLQ